MVNSIDFEAVFTCLPQPIVIVTIGEARIRFKQANPAFFAFTGLDLSDLHLGEDWLPALLKNESSSRGALSSQGLDTLRTFALRIKELEASKSNVKPRFIEIEGITFVAHSPSVPATYNEVDLEQKKKANELSMFFNNSIFGAFYMVLDEPFIWNENTDRAQAIDFMLHNLRLTRVNQAMLDQYGAALEDFIGRTPHDFFIHDLEQERRLLGDIFEKGKHRAVSFERDKNDREVIFEGDYVVQHDETDAIIGLFGLQQDITKRYRYIEKIETQNEKLREIAWLQSHVVRAPVARLLSIVDLLKDFEHLENDKKSNIVDFIKESTLEIDRVIAQIVRRTEAVDISAMEPDGDI